MEDAMLKKFSGIQEWEKPLINALTLKLIFAAAFSTAAAAGLAFILRKSGFGEIKPELLFMPWGIFLVVGVSISFHAGVMAERDRLAKEKETSEKK